MVQVTQGTCWVLLFENVMSSFFGFVLTAESPRYRSDSIQGINYIATQIQGFPGQKIENLRRQSGEDINFITFGKFVITLVQQQEKTCSQKLCNKTLTTNQFIHIFS